MRVSTEMASEPEGFEVRIKPILALGAGAGVYLAIATAAFWNVTVPTLPLVATAVLGALLMAASLADRLDLDLPGYLPAVLGGCGLLATLVMVPEALPSRIAGAMAGLAVMQALALTWRRPSARAARGWATCGCSGQAVPGSAWKVCRRRCFGLQPGC